MLRSYRHSPQHPYRLGRADEGAALLEFAIVAPVLLLLLLGIAEIGRALWYYQIVNTSVRDAVRYLARVPDPADADSQGAARNLALRGTLDGSGSLLIPEWDDGGTIGITVIEVPNPDTYRGPDPLWVIDVTATVPFNFPLLGFLQIPTTITMTVADQQRHIGE